MAIFDRRTRSELTRQSRQVATALGDRIGESLSRRKEQDRPPQHSMAGSITAVGFSSGHRVVIGNWARSPIGRFADVMWAEPDNWRTLFVATDAARSFVTAVYEFDSVHVVPELSVVQSRRRIQVEWSEARIELAVGHALAFPPRSAWLAERVERPIAEWAMGVHTHGVSPTGVEESYKARRLRRVIGGWGRAASRDLGWVGAPRPACRFGFSEPPPFPSMTELTTSLADPSGRLDEVLAAIGGTAATSRGRVAAGGGLGWSVRE